MLELGLVAGIHFAAVGEARPGDSSEGVAVLRADDPDEVIGLDPVDDRALIDPDEIATGEIPVADLDLDSVHLIGAYGAWNRLTPHLGADMDGPFRGFDLPYGGRPEPPEGVDGDDPQQQTEHDEHHEGCQRGAPDPGEAGGEALVLGHEGGPRGFRTGRILS